MSERSWPGVMSDGLSAERYFSIVNPWIDFIVVFDEESYSRNYVRLAIEKGMEEFWEGESEAYGDDVWRALTGFGIKKFMVFFHDTENESEEYEREWDFWTSELGKYKEVLDGTV